VYVTVALLSFFCLYLFWKPLILTIDSIYGFLAYKGTLQTGQFNVIAVVAPENINQVQTHFVSWWSPGQWLAPGLFQYGAGIRPGIAAILVTVLFSVSGLAGYYKLFTFYRFPPGISLMALFCITISSSFFRNYILYQGGEIISFGIFPWFLLYLLRLKELTLGKGILLTLFFLACFVAKTTLVIYCAAALIYKMVENGLQGFARTRQITALRQINGYYAFPLAISLAVIQFFFLDKGPVPVVVNKLNVSLPDVFIPLSSPLSSTFIVEPAIIGLTRRGIADNGSVSSLGGMIYLGLAIVVIGIGYRIIKSKAINDDYKWLLITLYGGVSAFLIFSYAMDTNIDYSSRHSKLVGYFFLPGFLTVLLQYAKKRWLNIGLGIAGVAAIAYFIYGKENWTKNRYPGISYFYRGFDPGKPRDEMDQASYKKLVSLNRYYNGSAYAGPVVFYVEASIDAAIDMEGKYIIKEPPKKSVSYAGHGPVIVACISKKTLLTEPGLLQQVFPDYQGFRLLDQTANYQYFISREGN